MYLFIVGKLYIWTSLDLNVNKKANLQSSTSTLSLLFVESCDDDPFDLSPRRESQALSELSNGTSKHAQCMYICVMYVHAFNMIVPQRHLTLYIFLTFHKKVSAIRKLRKVHCCHLISWNYSTVYDFFSSHDNDDKGCIDIPSEKNRRAHIKYFVL